ncbi:hypothetical protein C5469_02715 [Photorhabdus cinerea]|uniref:Uncharacterized protein n=1 Tax=Photorhabdus cinerea TaxID=471575 RepID=A0A7X5QB37_9GAMM|nr:hypothetical protein [Photorhabdus cinerea]
MSSKTFFLKPKAEQDLEAIFEYSYQEFGPELQPYSTWAKGIPGCFTHYLFSFNCKWDHYRKSLTQIYGLSTAHLIIMGL